MTETFNLVNQDKNTFVFYYTGNWVTWEKPKNCKFIYILCIGGGGGGGGGLSGTNTPRTGGGGGGNSGSANCLFMANTLPDTLYVFVGAGGVGGVPNGNGGNGVVSKVSISRNDYAPFIQNIVASSRQDAAAGTGGSANGTRGGSNTHITGFYLLRDLGFNSLPAGSFGGTGGSNIGGNGVGITSTSYTCGGAGGGGSSSGNTDGSGGSIVSYITLPGGLGGGTNNGASGLGITWFDENVSPYNGVTFLGGAGGGANGLGTGGNGGDGDFGCGGGGGGAGLIGGSGGKGGDGLVIIYAW